MLIRSLCLSGLVLGLAATAALPAEYQANPPSNAVHQRYHHGIRLPKELKVMWRQEERPKLKALPKEQRRGWIHARWQAMSDKERQATIARLQAKWDALPEKVRDAVLQRMRQKREARLMRRDEVGHNDKGYASRPMQQ